MLLWLISYEAISITAWTAWSQETIFLSESCALDITIPYSLRLTAVLERVEKMSKSMWDSQQRQPVLPGPQLSELIFRMPHSEALAVLP